MEQAVLISIKPIWRGNNGLQHRLSKNLNIPELVNALRICSGFVENPSCSECDYSLSVKCRRDMMHDAAAAIEALQAQLQKRGKWVRVEDGESYHYECSECGERPLYSRFGDIVLSGVCPMCGAKMEAQE